MAAEPASGDVERFAALLRKLRFKMHYLFLLVVNTITFKTGVFQERAMKKNIL